MSPSPDDQKWYRVMLNDISETTVSVNFVDYGHKMKLPKENLRPITPSFLTLPFQEVRCSLAGTVSANTCSCRWYRIVFFMNIQMLNFEIVILLIAFKDLLQRFLYSANTGSMLVFFFKMNICIF